MDKVDRMKYYVIAEENYSAVVLRSREFGLVDNFDVALEIAYKVIDDSLGQILTKDMTSADLYKEFLSWGETPQIWDENRKLIDFDSADYLEVKCNELANK